MLQACLMRALRDYTNGIVERRQDILSLSEKSRAQNEKIIAQTFDAAINNATNKTILAQEQHLKQRFYDIWSGKVSYNGGYTLSKEDSELFGKIIDQYSGNYRYVDFWGMGCGPCRNGMMNDRELVEKMKDKPVKFIYVTSVDQSPKDYSENWMAENNIKGEHIFLTENEWKSFTVMFQFSGILFSLIVDRDGKIVSANYGFATYLRVKVFNIGL